ncbi:relaxase/mobilization nuclease domain-containing protein, partial [Campylobacter upsaliensis]|uniref:relaxase/mobilization nuclease domain-containing protein n=1 Tax=Campylobacter upsaliensis TaxID=28080 RepID=UPI00214A81C3
VTPIKKFFAHPLSEFYLKTNHNNLFQNSFSSKQVIIKNLSNLDEVGAKNAMAYVIRNSSDDFIIDERGNKRKYNELICEWKKDFSCKKNSKEVWHLTFGINERKSEKNLKILEESVREVLEKNFFEYKYAYVLHTHQGKPHVHILINKNNQFTRKKLHLQKNEFKDFFTTLRNDFAFALNLRGLEYHNHFRLEKDLKRQKEKLEMNSTFSKSVYDDLVYMQENLEEKINTMEEKIQIRAEELKNLYNEKNHHLLEEIAKFKKIDKNHKKLYSFFKKLKQVNNEIKKEQMQIKLMRNQIISFKKDKHQIELEKMKYENLKEEEILNLAKKNALLSFYKNKLSNKNLSKKALNTIMELEKDIENASNEADETLQAKLKHSLLVSSLLSKKANTFHLIKAYEELEKNLNFLQLSRFDGEEIKKIESRLKNNQVLIKNLLEDSFIYLENDLKNKVQLSLVKEYEKVSQFLNKNNEEEVKKLYALLETKQEKSEKVGVGGSKKIKEVKKENILKND